MSEKNHKQDLAILDIKKDMEFLSKTMKDTNTSIKSAMEKYGKVAEKERVKCEQRVTDMINSFNGQAENWKMACDEKFATKDEMEGAEPIISLFGKIKEKLTMIGTITVLLFFGAAAIGLGLVDFIKHKLIHLLH